MQAAQKATEQLTISCLWLRRGDGGLSSVKLLSFETAWTDTECDYTAGLNDLKPKPLGLV